VRCTSPFVDNFISWYIYRPNMNSPESPPGVAKYEPVIRPSKVLKPFSKIRAIFKPVASFIKSLIYFSVAPSPSFSYMNISIIYITILILT